MDFLLRPQNMTVLALLAAIGVLLTALAFQHIGGYIPCTLCYLERYAYYAAIPLSLLALLAFNREQHSVGLVIMGILALAFLANAVLGGYHAGAEWKWWPGPATCAATSSVSGNAGGLLESLKTIKVIKCDEASFRMFGLSFAGYNVLLSLALAGLLLSSIGKDRKKA